jgi:hypothetical protein
MVLNAHCGTVTIVPINHQCPMLVTFRHATQHQYGQEETQKAYGKESLYHYIATNSGSMPCHRLNSHQTTQYSLFSNVVHIKTNVQAFQHITVTTLYSLSFSLLQI